MDRTKAYVKGRFDGLLQDAKDVGKVVGLIAIPVALLMVQICCEFWVTEYGYRISEATSRHEQLRERHRKLSIERGVEGRTTRVTTRAKRRLGLEQVEPEQIVEIQSRRAEGPVLDDSSRAALEREAVER